MSSTQNLIPYGTIKEGILVVPPAGYIQQTITITEALGIREIETTKTESFLAAPSGLMA